MADKNLLLKSQKWKEICRKVLSNPLTAFSILFALVKGCFIKLKYNLLNKNVQIGSNLRAYCGLDIKGPGRVIIGNKVSLHLSFLRIPSIITHTKNSVVKIGNGTILGGVRISCVDSVTIGDDALLGSTTIMDSDVIPYRFMKLDDDWIKANVSPVKIGSRIWTGTNSFILKGSILHDEVVLGSGSLIREKEVPEKTVMIGNPARKISNA